MSREFDLTFNADFLEPEHIELKCKIERFKNIRKNKILTNKIQLENTELRLKNICNIIQLTNKIQLENIELKHKIETLKNIRNKFCVK
jgi:hypothetical protein